MENMRKEVRGVANGIGFTAWNLTYIPSAFIGWNMLKWTKGWTIPLAAIMYVSVTAYVTWHLRDLEKSKGKRRRGGTRTRTKNFQSIIHRRR